VTDSSYSAFSGPLNLISLCIASSNSWGNWTRLSDPGTVPADHVFLYEAPVDTTLKLRAMVAWAPDISRSPARMAAPTFAQSGTVIVTITEDCESSDSVAITMGRFLSRLDTLIPEIEEIMWAKHQIKAKSIRVVEGPDRCQANDRENGIDYSFITLHVNVEEWP
jgi:hypothetical protein